MWMLRGLRAWRLECGRRRTAGWILLSTISLDRRAAQQLRVELRGTGCPPRVLMDVRPPRQNRTRLSIATARMAPVAAIAAGTMMAAPAHAQLRPPPARIAQDGFGDHRNSYAWSMAWFK